VISNGEWPTLLLRVAISLEWPSIRVKVVLEWRFQWHPGSRIEGYTLSIYGNNACRDSALPVALESPSGGK